MSEQRISPSESLREHPQNDCRVPEGETPVTWEDLKIGLGFVVGVGVFIFLVFSTLAYWFDTSPFDGNKGWAKTQNGVWHDFSAYDAGYVDGRPINAQH